MSTCEMLHQRERDNDEDYGSVGALAKTMYKSFGIVS